MRCLFSSFPLPVCAGRLREAELFAAGVLQGKGREPLPGPELAQEAGVLLDWLGPGSWAATAPVPASLPLASRVSPGFPQLTAVSQPHQPALPVSGCRDVRQR